MPQNMKAAIIKCFALNALICLVISLGLNLLLSSGPFDLQSIVWLLWLALAVGAISAIAMLIKIKSVIKTGLALPYDLLKIQPSERAQFDFTYVRGVGLQLNAMGYRHLGDYTIPAPQRRYAQCLAGIYLDPTGTILVEVQYLTARNKIPAAQAAAVAAMEGIHYSVYSNVKGAIPITSTNHTATAAHYLMRGDNAVSTTYPDMALAELLHQHEKLVKFIEARTQVDRCKDLTVPRYVALQRDTRAQATARVSKLNAWQIVQALDAFNAKPRSRWTPDTATLKTLAVRPLHSFDAAAAQTSAGIAEAAAQRAAAEAKAANPFSDFSGPAPTKDSPEPEFDFVHVSRYETEHSATSTHYAPPQTDAEVPAADREYNPKMDDYRDAINSSANWFYWIAALSAINAVVTLAGSTWGFGLGLGLAQLLAGIGSALGSEDVAGAVVGAVASSATDIAPVEALSMGMVLLCWVGVVALISFFAWVGYAARKPSFALFLTGFLLYALDTAIFLVAGDIFGLALHGLALFFLFNGLMKIRVLNAL